MIVELSDGKRKDLTYEEAGKLLIDKLTLGSIQISSYHNFIDNIIKRHLGKSKVYKEDGFELSFDSWWIDETSKTLPINVCKSEHRSYEVSLMALVKLKFTDKFYIKNDALPENTITFPVEITRFPKLLPTGSFIINGVDRVAISHLEKADRMVISPPSNKVKSQIGQLELRDRLGSSLVMDKKITFRLAKPILGIPGRSISYSFKHALERLGYDEEVFDSIVECSVLHSSNDTQVSSVNAPIQEVMNNFHLDACERFNLNARTSFKKTLVGKVLAKDVKAGDTVYKAGLELTSALGEEMQEAGILSVEVEEDGISSVIFNNGFVDTEPLFEQYGLEIPEDFIMYAQNPLDHDKLTTYYLQCNKPFFDELVKIYGHDKEQLQYQILLNIDKITGTCIVKTDIISMLSIFSRAASGFTSFDDIDNLENKKVVNIADIFETCLVDAIGSGKTHTHPSLVGKIKKARMNSSTKLNDSGSQLLLKMDFNNLNCGENTITNYTKTCSLFSFEDNTNPLAQISNKRKITLAQVDGRGGIRVSSTSIESRTVNPSYSGRVDCIKTPESQSVGLVREIGTLAHLNEHGQLEAPFFKVDHKNKVIDTSKVYYLEYGEETSYKRVLAPKVASKTGVQIKYYKGLNLVKVHFHTLPTASIGTVDETMYKRLAQRELRQDPSVDRFKIEIHKRNWFIENTLTLQYGHGQTITGTPDDVDFVSCAGGEHIFSPTTSSIPFLEFDDAARGAMGGIMGVQAVPVFAKKKQTVRTPMAKPVATIATGVITAPYDLQVESVDALGITVKPLGSEETEYLPCLRNLRTTKSTINNSIPCVKVGDVCLKGDVIADNASTLEGELAHGTELNIAICPAYGSNYEDGVIISSAIVKQDTLTSIHIEEVLVSIRDGELTNKDNILKGKLKAHEKIDVDSNRYTYNAFIKVGAEVTPGDILAVKQVVRETTNEDGVALSEYVAVVTRYTETVPGTVIAIDSYVEGNETKYVIKVAHKLKMGRGDKYTGRHGNKGIVCKILPEEDMPYIQATGERMDIVINPLGIPSRMNFGQVIEGQTSALLHKLGLRAIVRSVAGFDIESLKRAVKLGRCGKQQLCSGKTGKPFMYLTTVVRPYIVKLEHLVEHKIHARACKPYTRKNQPTQGKARNGGQRFGEMEFWVLTAHGACAVQREITMFRSDDVGNRNAYIKAKQALNDVAISKLQNRTQDVSHAFLLSDVAYKSCFKRLVYFDANGQEIDITKNAGSKDRSMQATLDRIKAKRDKDQEQQSYQQYYTQPTEDDEEYQDDDLSAFDDFNMDLNFAELFDVGEDDKDTSTDSQERVHTVNLKSFSFLGDYDESGEYEEDGTDVEYIQEDYNEDDYSGEGSDDDNDLGAPF